MKKIKEYLRKNIHIWGAVAVIATSILLAIFLFSNSYIDLIKSIIYTIEYFDYIFGSKSTAPVAPIGDISLILPTLPKTLEAKLKIWGLMFLSGESYSIFFGKLLNFIVNALMLCSFVIPMFLIGKILIKTFYLKTNTKHGQETLPLRAYKKLSKYTITPTVGYVKGSYDFIKKNKAVKAILIIVWLLNLNVITIVMPFIPFYLSFSMSFDFMQVYDYLRFVIYSMRYSVGIALIVTLPITLYITDRICQKKAVKKLNKFEEHNEETLAWRDISTYKWGFMGSGKTKSMTDEALSISVHDTKVANELKNQCKKMFPFFPWLLFEKDLEKAINDRKIYNWATTIDYVTQIANDFNSGISNFYGYDTKKYGMNYYNGVVVENLFKVLENYGRLHFLYVFNGSFIIM